MKKKIIIIYDQHKRDFESLLRICNKLQKRGVAIYLVPKSYLVYFAYSIKPDAIILSNPDHYLGEIAMICSEHFKIYSIPTEQFFFSKKHFFNRVVKGHNYGTNRFMKTDVNIIDTFFVWSNQHVNFLIDKNIKLNSYPIGSIKYHSNLNKNKNKNKKITVGVIIEETNPINFVSMLYSNRNSDWPMKPDSQLINEIQSTFAQIKILERVKNKNIKVLIKSYWTDKAKDFNKILMNEKFSFYSENSNEFFFKNVDVVLTCKSTLGYECYLYDIPVVSVQNLLEHKINYKHGFPKHPCRPNSISEAVNFCLNPHKIKNDYRFTKKIKDFFGVQYDAADNLFNFITNDKKRKKRINLDSKFKEKVLKKFSFTENLIYKYCHIVIIRYIFRLYLVYLKFTKKKLFNNF